MSTSAEQTQIGLPVSTKTVTFCSKTLALNNGTLMLGRVLSLMVRTVARNLGFRFVEEVLFFGLESEGGDEREGSFSEIAIVSLKTGAPLLTVTENGVWSVMRGVTIVRLEVSSRKRCSDPSDGVDNSFVDCDGTFCLTWMLGVT